MTAVLSSRHNNLAMPAPPRNVLYWSESVNGWWTGISRRHLACGGGWLSATPPDALATGPGAVICLRCAADVAEIRRRRPHVVTPEQWAALPVEQGTRRGDDSAPTKPCPDCGIRQTRVRNARCRACWVAWRRQHSHAARLVDLLKDGQARSRSELCEALALDSVGLRQIIKTARVAGYTIARRGRRDAAYRLEVAS